MADHLTDAEALQRGDVFFKGLIAFAVIMLLNSLLKKWIG